MADEEDVKYCRREISETPPKLCMKAITHKNALNWCDECRAARLPFWPTGDAVKDAALSAPSAAHEPLTLDALEAA